MGKGGRSFVFLYKNSVWFFLSNYLLFLCTRNKCTQMYYFQFCVSTACLRTGSVPALNDNIVVFAHLVQMAPFIEIRATFHVNKKLSRHNTHKMYVNIFPSNRTFPNCYLCIFCLKRQWMEHGQVVMTDTNETKKNHNICYKIFSFSSDCVHIRDYKILYTR